MPMQIKLVCPPAFSSMLTCIDAPFGATQAPKKPYVIGLLNG